MSLSKGEVAVGMHVTVLEWHERKLTDGTMYRERSYIGDELEVIAVNLPFVKVLTHNKWNDRFEPRTLNMNELLLLELSEDFINPKPIRCAFCGYQKEI